MSHARSFRLRLRPMGGALLLAYAVVQTSNAQATGVDGDRRIPKVDVPLMVEQHAKAGIDTTYDGPWEFFVGGGAASFDCNGDRRPDLAIAGGTNEAALFVNESPTGGELRFRKSANPFGGQPLDDVTGFYAIDLDNDGNKDLVALRVGENLILKGEGNCSFTRANREFGYEGGRAWTTAFAATFEPGNAFPTLAIGNYVDRSAPGSPWGTCHDNQLIRPSLSDGKPQWSEPEVLSPGHCALSMLFTDWNRTGQPDLRITNDRHYYRGGEEQLWRIEAGRAARPYRTSEGWRTVRIWGMGIAEADLDSDGFPEYALTSMGDTKLQTLDEDADEGSPIYRDIAFEKGATAHRPYTGTDLKPSTGWHAEFADMNNDGLLDLFIAKGNVEQMPDFTAFDPDNLLLGEHDGKFSETGDMAGIALPTKGRGAVIADFNMDGMLDLLVVNRGGPASLFRNTGRAPAGGPMGNWLAIELRQKGANRDAVGALINVKSGNETRTRRVQVGGGHASGHLGFIHAGTGTAERAEIRIKWPDGEWSPPYRVFANNFVVIERGATSARYWYPE